MIVYYSFTTASSLVAVHETQRETRKVFAYLRGDGEGIYDRVVFVMHLNRRREYVAFVRRSTYDVDH